jgi:hypothetical protein
MAKTVGQFTYDETDGTISGPATYMREEGNALIARISAGQETDMLARFMDSGTPDALTAILLLIQTKYAAWIGYRSYFGGGR